jgi:hypothetical protein
MKISLLILVTIFHISCSSSMKKKNLSDRIQAEEVRSYQEIESHSDILLNEHPELDQETKMELKHLLRSTMLRHKELRDQESKIFKLLLDKSLAHNQNDQEIISETKVLKKNLQEVYEQKSQIILNLIKRIVELSQKNMISKGFREDLLILIREFR